MFELIAKSEKTREILRIAERVAATDATVLITGESGTGKNALCEFIHQKSKRAAQNLVKIDCAALPKELLEAELFGWEKGAFTGASEARAGRLEAADKSTLLLDEIALLPTEAQAKLLRVLEQREFERLGGRHIIKIDARLLATTNVDLETAIAEKNFRQDLFFRLNIIRIELPPLRERREDIRAIAENFMQTLAAKYKREDLKLNADALRLLTDYDFPGNLRELANLIERAVVSSSQTEITAKDFPAILRDNSNEKKWLTLEETEKKHVLETLALTSGNKTEAARLLGISRKNLYEKLARYQSKK